MAKSAASGSGVGTSLPAGVVMPFAGEVIPSGWLLCNGQQVSRSSFGDLFNAIGTLWGEGDGSSTFHIPDMRGLFLRGKDDGTGRDPDAGSRTAINTGGSTADSVGSYQADDFKSHNHQVTDRLGAYGSGGDALLNRSGSGDSYNTINRGGNETRPVNVYVNYIIKV